MEHFHHCRKVYWMVLVYATPKSLLLILVLLLRLSVQIWHKFYLWDLQHCSTDLTGKTAVVTGANSGECSS